MALINPPLGLQNAGNTHTAAMLRTVLAGLQAGNFSASTNIRARGGIHPTLGSELVVTQAGSPNMTVLVGSGIASVPGSESGSQGNYLCINDASVTLTVTAAHATLARIDIVVLNVRDAFYSGASNDSQLQVIAGTPASSPVAPSAPANSITIAQIAVGAAVTSIVNANITDLRFYLAAAGGVINARTEATRPASAEIAAGQHVWAMDTGKLYLWDGTAYNQTYPGFNKISETILSGTAASITFSSIPSTFRSLRIQGVGRGDTAATSVEVRMQFNGDTTAIYDTQVLAGQGAAASAAETLAATFTKIGEMGAASAAAGNGGLFVIDIPWYAGTTFWKLMNAGNADSIGTASGNLINWPRVGRWRSTSAITSLSIFPAAGNFIAGTSFALYGIL